MIKWCSMSIKGQGHSLALANSRSVFKLTSSFSSKKLLGYLKPNTMWKLVGAQEWKLIQMVQVKWPRWLPCPYMIKTLKNLLFQNQQADSNEMSMQHLGLRSYSLFKLWPLVDFYLFYASDKFGRSYFCMGKIDFFPKLLQLMISKLVNAFRWMSKWSQMSVKGQGHSLTLIKVTQASKLNLWPQKVMGHLNTNFMLQLLGAVEQNN